tara:strand:+ start:373 stop:729 length:357 start_codon:yes stop_codon:yes gene_type:complete
MSDNTQIFSDADEKTIRDTVNKQRRLVELYAMGSLAGNAKVTAEQLEKVIVASNAVASLVMESAAGHQAATVKAATSLMGATMIAQMQASKLSETKELLTSKPVKAAPKKAAKAAKKA